VRELGGGDGGKLAVGVTNMWQAMEAGKADHVWSLEEIAALAE
jgi:hypothetical protein